MSANKNIMDETLAIDAVTQYVERRYGTLYRLRKLVLLIDGPQGGQITTQLNPILSYLRHASSPHNPLARHGPDFRSVYWFGKRYLFSELQAAIVRVLWKAWENGTPDVGAPFLLEQAGSDREIKRMDMVFHEHAAWGAMIVTRANGAYRLTEPADFQEDMQEC